MVFMNSIKGSARYPATEHLGNGQSPDACSNQCGNVEERRFSAA
jgi:hypothetical protein